MTKSARLMAILVTAMFLTVLLPMSFDGAGANYAKDASISIVDASFVGSQVSKNMGYSEFVSSRGDVNGDGYDDLLIPAQMYNNASTVKAGKVFLFFGKGSGWAKNKGIDTADVIFTGELANDEAGVSAAIVQDVNGDGFDDILISTIAQPGNFAGRTYLIFGAPNGWVKTYYLANASVMFEGVLHDDWAGNYVAGAGDVNGDGYGDILIGAPQAAKSGNAVDRNGIIYLFLGKSSGWAKHTSLSTANASFYGPLQSKTGGYQIGPGDINGDGYDDLLIANTNYNQSTGIVYIIFGKPTGWTTGVNLSLSADASIVGERLSSLFGYGISAAADLNGDGYKDIVIGAGYDGEAGFQAGQVYVFLGKPTGWKKYFNVTGADASYLGEGANNYAGYPFDAGGDVNGDGLGDMFIAANGNAGGGNSCGKVYVVLGKKTGWAKDVSLSQADGSFVGEANSDWLGESTMIPGDLNGDGFDDLAVDASNNAQGGIHAGKFYAIFYDTNKGPTAITSVKTYSSVDYTNETGFAMTGDKIYVELRGTDGNASRKDVAVVKLTSDASTVGYTLRLYETAVNSGVYRGSFVIKDRTSQEFSWIKGLLGQKVTAASVKDPAKKVDIIVGAVAIMPKTDVTTAVEDQLYNAHYWVSNATHMDGSMTKNATWLEMNGSTGNLSGTPDNTEVGSFWVDLKVTDGFGRSDEHNFTIVVANTPPVIQTTNVLTATEDQLYSVDYNSSDDGQGTITWSMQTNASAWLSLNATSGNLTGNPINADVGQYYVNITVNDGNGGTDSTNFTLTVLNVNDRPGISTTDVLTATEDVLYNVDYNAVDVDAGDALTWSLKTDAGAWLKINATSGVLSGTPTNDNVGQHYVNVTVKDTALSSDYHNFTLTVENAEDAPVWKDVPAAEVKINSLQVYIFDLNATDVDVGDILHYGVLVTPSVNAVTMNLTTGVLSIGPVDAGLYNVNLSVTDGTVKIYSVFTLNVSHKNSPPTATLVSPLAGATSATAKPTLTWSTLDKDLDAVTVDVYVSDVEASVNTKAASAKVLSASKVKTYSYTTYLIPGKKYFWTVIPFDGNDTGACLNGTFNFTVSASAKVNHAPTITPPAKVPDATTGKTYKLTVAGADQDAGTTLTYSLTGAPTGMSISNSGQITWKPTKSQTGPFTFNVVVSDGEFSASTPVTLKVKKAQEATMSSYIVPILLILVLVIAAIVLLAVSMRKKPADKEEDEEDKEEAEDEEEEEAETDEEEEAEKKDEPEDEKAEDEEDADEKKSEDKEEEDEEKDGDEEKEEADEDEEDEK